MVKKSKNKIEPSLPYYLPIDEVGIEGFMSLLRALVLSEIQTALSRFSTQVTDSISHDDNCYAKQASTTFN